MCAAHRLADSRRAAEEESVELLESLGEVVEATSSLTWNLTIWTWKPLHLTSTIVLISSHLDWRPLTVRYCLTDSVPQHLLGPGPRHSHLRFIRSRSGLVCWLGSDQELLFQGWMDTVTL